MGRRPKLWAWTAGAHGSSVRVAERVPGGPIYAMTPRKGGGWLKVGLGHRDRERAMAEASALAVRRGKGDTPLDRLNVAGLFALYSSAVLPTQSERHREELRRAMALWTRVLGPGRTVETIGPADWEAFIRRRGTGELDGRGRLVEDPTDRRPVRTRTMARELKVLRAACRRAAIERTRAGGFLLPHDPTRGLALPVERNPARPTCDSDRFESLIAVAHLVRMRVGKGKEAASAPSYLPTLLRLAHDTGRRIGSILALRWADWRPDQGLHGHILWRARHDKVKRDWLVPVTAAVRAELEVERERRGVSLGSDALLFPCANDPTKIIDIRVVTRWLEAAERLAGLPEIERFGWHAFRRGWATARKALPVQDVAACGGWADIATLQRVYQAADQATLEQVVNAGGRVEGVLR